MGYIFIIAMVLLIGFSTEIRCTLGNKGVCQVLEAPLEQQKDRK